MADSEPFSKAELLNLSTMSGAEPVPDLDSLKSISSFVRANLMTADDMKELLEEDFRAFDIAKRLLRDNPVLKAQMGGYNAETVITLAKKINAFVKAKEVENLFENNEDIVELLRESILSGGEGGRANLRNAEPDPLDE